LILETKQIFFSSPLVRIERVGCHRAQRGLSCAECKTEHQISLPLTGVNVRQVHGKLYTMSPLHFTFSNRGEEYRVAHPFGSGETQLNIVLDEALLRDMLHAEYKNIDRPFRDPQIPADARLHVAARMLAKRAQQLPAIEVEESVIALADRILAHATGASPSTSTPREWQLAQRARALLAHSYSQPLTLEKLAKCLDVSVYHLCRSFKRATGATLWSEIQGLRTRAALSRLDDGELDLTELGLSLGYSHHSHFTASFRRELKITPSQARLLFARGSTANLRQLFMH
jgi:AraC family transcriptional regulator